MAGEQDTEYTLSTAKLLVLFFGLVVVCGIFFSLGYAVGKNNAPGASQVVMESSALADNPTSGAAKPGAAHAAAPATDCASATDNCKAEASQDPGTASTPEMSVQKQLQQKDANPQLVPASDPAKTDAAKTDASKQPAPELNNASSTGFMVQVAAVSKQEDADALVSALRKKQYPVIMVPNPENKLFHVQVGPFADKRDADSMRAKLVGDGYNAFVKK